MGFLANMPLISIAIALPILGVIAVSLIPKTRTVLLRWLAFGFSAASFIVSLPLLSSPDFASFTHVEYHPWMPQLHAYYLVGVDGISVWLVLLTGLLAPLAILSSFSAIRSREKEFYILLLLMQSSLVGTFCALDLVLFFLFWEMVLIPMYLLIGIWGSGRRIYAATKFVLYTVVGSFIMLLAIIGLYVYSGANGEASFDFTYLRMHVLSPEAQTWLFLAFALAFAIKMPLFPFHTWLADAHTEAPTAGSVLLAGVLLKMGGYGFLRFCLPLFPDATAKFAPLFMALAVISIIYGALVSAAQQDLKRLIALSSVSHMGFVVLGIFAFSGTVAGQIGAVVQMISHGVATGALFLLAGVIYERKHTRELAQFGGLAAVMPRYYNIFLITMLASIGLPALSGFVGEFLVLLGAIYVDWMLAGLAAMGIILAAVYMLTMFRRVFHGECTRPENCELKDLNARELAYLIPLVVMMFAIGLHPRPFVDSIRPAAERAAQTVTAIMQVDTTTQAQGAKR